MYQYPYGNAQQLNLDWLMEQWQEVKQSIDGSLQGEIDRVEAAITDLLNARDAAVAAAGAANTSAGAAAQSAQAAAGDAATATAQAAAATQERVNAAQFANAAQGHANTAQVQATAAGNSAGAAAVSASQAAASASDAHDDSQAAAGNALYSEGFAVGEQNGTPVSSGSPYYENNAKYYANSIAADAAAADADALVAEGFAVGEQNGTPVSSGSPYYENNAEYFANAAAAAAATADGAAAQAMIAAPVEATTTATAAHAKDTFFRYNGALYIATEDIAIGDTITVGTNCAATTAGAAITQLNQYKAAAITREFQNIFIPSGSSSYSNRTVAYRKNKVTITRTGSGSGFAVYSLTGKKYQQTNISSVTSAIVTNLFNNGCFVDFPAIRRPYTESSFVNLSLECRRYGTACSDVRTFLAIATPDPEEASGYKLTYENLDYTNNIFYVNSNDIVYVDIRETLLRKLATIGAKICVFIHVQSAYATVRAGATVEFNLLPVLSNAKMIRSITPYYAATGDTAPTAVPKDSLFFWTNTLYKATVDIAAGETLTVGTNIAATSLNAELTLLR